MIDPQYYIDHYNDFPFLIKLACITSLVIGILIILLMVYLKFVRMFLRAKELESTNYRNDYEAMLIEYLYSGGDDGQISETQQAIIEELKDHVVVKSKRKAIVSTLYRLMSEVSGEISDSIKVLYYNTGLIDYATSKLHHKKWDVVAKGIGELTCFRIEEAHDEIVKFIDHPRMEVRKETELYLVNIFSFEGLSFLDTLKTTLSEWHQVQILEVLQKIDDQEICDIRPWLLSANDSVVLFALKLAKVYNQFEVKDTLMGLLSHNNKEVRLNVIEVFTHLYGIEAKDKLKANFGNLSLEEQISFFGMLEKLVVPSDEPFVEKHLFHKDFEIQMLALKILKAINVDKYLGLNKLPTHQKSEAMLKLANAI